MAKAILMSIRPQYVAKILNGEKTIEIRKKFPKDYVGWVYIYCTKENDVLLYNWRLGKYWASKTSDYHIHKDALNGKVVARFWCDKVEEHRPFFHWCIEKETCLTRDDVLDYLDSKDKFVGNPKRQGKVYAIHITKLEIFDKPKEIYEIRKPIEYTKYCSRNCIYCDYAGFNYKNMQWEFECSLTRAPQSWQFIEV